MKALLLATAMIAAPLLAQSDVGTSITTRSATSSSADKPLQDPSTMTEKDAQQPNDTSITTRSSTSPQPDSRDQAGQLPPPAEPATTPMSDPGMTSGPAPTGGQVVFQQPPTVEQAFPPPAAKENYPFCSRTVTDACRQRVDPK